MKRHGLVLVDDPSTWTADRLLGSSDWCVRRHDTIVARFCERLLAAAGYGWTWRETDGLGEALYVFACADGEPDGDFIIEFGMWYSCLLDKGL